MSDRSSAAVTAVSKLLVWGLVMLVRAYRVVLSPWFGPVCRFEPSCSQYAIEALREHGVGRGGWLALRRLSRCHPMGSHGFDPVPERGTSGP